MALWMEAGSEPKTEKELADLDAISALKESTAFELKVFIFILLYCTLITLIHLCSVHAIVCRTTCITLVCYFVPIAA